MAALIAVSIKHSSDEIRSLAARLFASMSSNEKKIQAFANRMGALNLAIQFNKESNPKMKEIILGALLAYIKAENFDAKRKFLFFYEGIETLSNWVIEDAKQPSPINPQQRKIRLKLVQFLNDITTNDDSILRYKRQSAQDFKAGKKRQPFSARVEFGNSMELIKSLLTQFEEADLSAVPNYQLREYTLGCLMRIYRKSPQLKDEIERVLQPHLQNLKNCSDEKRQDNVANEVERVDKVLAVDAERANGVEDPVNFPDVKPVVIMEWPSSKYEDMRPGDMYIGLENDKGQREGYGVYKWASESSSDERFSGHCYEGTY